MNYSNLTLLLSGMMGVLLHILFDMNKLNKQPEYNFTLIKYLKAEVFSILISIVVVGVCIVIKQEIQSLEQVGNKLGLGFIAIGYMGQSLLVKFIGKAEKIIE